MVVIVILGLASAAVVLAIPDQGGSLQAEAERFAARARAARDVAIVESRPVALLIDGGGYSVARRTGGEWVEGTRREWVDGTEVEASGTAEGRIRFDSTGLAEPLHLTLRREDQQVAVRIGHDGEIHVQR